MFTWIKLLKTINSILIYSPHQVVTYYADETGYHPTITYEDVGTGGGNGGDNGGGGYNYPNRRGENGGNGGYSYNGY